MLLHSLLMLVVKFFSKYALNPLILQILKEQIPT